MKKVLSVILSLIMVLCVMPAGAAFASGQSTITPGQTVEVTIDYSGDQHFITFTPQKTGEYRIVSHLGDDIVTPWCFVLDSNGETIAEDMGGDDTEGQVNPNVDITAEFNAGEEYLILCQSTAITEPVIYYVELIEVNPSEPEIPEVSAPVISAFDITETSFSIKWEPVNGATEYLIYDISKNPAVHIDTIKENQYTFSNCTPDTEYNIRVTAANSKYSASADCSVTTLKEEPPQEKLEPPTGFNVYARGDGGTDLYLDWDDVAGADGYRVYTNCGTGDILKGDVKISQFTFTDLTPAWEYDAKIVAYNGAGEASAVYRICAAPAPTGNLKASVDNNTITATWDVQASHGYYIQWSTDETFTKNVSGAFINGSGSTSYTINVANAQDYYVRVRAWKWYQDSRLYSDFCEPVKPSIALTAPTGFNVYARGDGGTDLYLDWDDVAGADGYRVYTNCGPGDVFEGETKDSQFTFTDLTPAWEYDAKVVAYNETGEVSAVYRICAAPAPTDSLKASADNNTITATWVEQASHGYYIQWSTDETFTKNVSGTFINGSASTSYTINVANAQDYYVRVRAWKWYQGSRVYSDFCEPVKPSIALTAPTGFNVYARGDGGTDLYLDWDDVAGADGYRVYTNCGTGDILKGDVKISQFTFTDLTPAWEYDAKIVAYNEEGEVSAVYRICAAPAPTDSLKVSATGNTITATWVEQASHGYYIQWSTDETFTKNVSGAFINGSASTSYTINVANAQDYYVRVRAWKWYQGSRVYSDFCEPVSVSK